MSEFTKAFQKQVLLFDGAMGTEIQKLNPKLEDFPDKKDGFNDGLNLTDRNGLSKYHRII